MQFKYNFEKVAVSTSLAKAGRAEYGLAGLGWTAITLKWALTGGKEVGLVGCCRRQARVDYLISTLGWCWHWFAIMQKGGRGFMLAMKVSICLAWS